MDQIYEEYVGIHLKSKKFIDSLSRLGTTTERGRQMKKIAVDAMGGDYAPQAIVEGV